METRLQRKSFKIKRLNLDWWMKDFHPNKQRLKTSHPELVEAVPVFHRDGWYFVDGISWFEVGGLAFMYEPEMFKHELVTLNAGELNQEQVFGLKAICRSNLATKEQRRKLYFWHHFMELRAIRRETQKRFLKYA